MQTESLTPAPGLRQGSGRWDQVQFAQESRAPVSLGALVRKAEPPEARMRAPATADHAPDRPSAVYTSDFV